jgi:GTP-binding protein
VTLIGRSNVGKSTIINALARQSIAKTSKTPGRTQTVNFYDFDKYRLVDLPGYGYLKGSNQLQEQITSIINTYLSERKNLFIVIQVCDANVITPQDVTMSTYLSKKFKHHYVVLNKIDKQSLSIYQNNLKKIANYLRIKEDKVLLVSAKNKINIKNLNTLIRSNLQ